MIGTRQKALGISFFSIAYCLMPKKRLKGAFLMKDEFDLSPLQLDALREIGNIGANGTFSNYK